MTDLKNKINELLDLININYKKIIFWEIVLVVLIILFNIVKGF